MPDDEMTFDGNTCQGTCHDERHRDREWYESR
jgi:hypothetical protein